MKNRLYLIFLIVFVFFTQVDVFAFSLDTLVVQSTNMQRDVEVLLIKPTKPIEQNTPIVFLLHGYGGNHLQWLDIKPQLPQLADHLNVVFVCPNAYNSWYWDSPKLKNSQYESFFISELIPFLAINEDLVCKPEQTAITGLSMGGHGALWYASRYPHIFGAVGSMSGGVDLREFAHNWNLEEHLDSFTNNVQIWNKHTVTAQLSDLLKSDQAIIIDCGVDDFFYSVNVKLHEELLSNKRAHDFIIRPGAHNRAYWNNAIDYQLLFFWNYFHQKRLLVDN